MKITVFISLFIIYYLLGLFIFDHLMDSDKDFEKTVKEVQVAYKYMMHFIIAIWPLVIIAAIFYYYKKRVLG